MSKQDISTMDNEEPGSDEYNNLVRKIEDGVLYIQVIGCG
jgi:hypothetical protein